MVLILNTFLIDDNKIAITPSAGLDPSIKDRNALGVNLRISCVGLVTNVLCLLNQELRGPEFLNARV